MLQLYYDFFDQEEIEFVLNFFKLCASHNKRLNLQMYIHKSLPFHYGRVIDNFN